MEGRHLDRFTLHKDEAALLIIDIQERLAPAIYDQETVVDRSIRLLQAAIEMELPVLVTEQYPKGLGPTVPAIRDLLAERLPHLKPFEKLSFTAYTSDVASALAANGRKKIIIVGMETHVCVFQTTRQLLSEGYQVFIVRDAISSRTSENRENAFQQMAEMGAVITNSETILFDLVKVAGSPLFKKISQLVK